MKHLLVTATWVEGTDILPRLQTSFVFLAVRQVSRGIYVKWNLMNVAHLLATMMPFAKILLIATSATAGQVSRSHAAEVTSSRWAHAVCYVNPFVTRLQRCLPPAHFPGVHFAIYKAFQNLKSIHIRLKATDWGDVKGYNQACKVTILPNLLIVICFSLVTDLVIQYEDKVIDDTPAPH